MEKSLKRHIMKSFTKDSHPENFSLITLKFACYCYPRLLIPYDPTENFQRYSISFVLSIFSITLVFQCDFQCQILLMPLSDKNLMLSDAVI